MLFFSAIKPRTNPLDILSKPSPWKIFRQAFLITSLNPKALVFIVALLPQFITDSAALTPQITTICVVSAAIHFTIYFGYALLAQHIAKLSSISFGRKIFDKLSGMTFLIFGVVLGFTNTP